MPPQPRPFTCIQCLLKPLSRPRKRWFHTIQRLQSEAAEPPRPSVAPKVVIDIKHIRQNAAAHEQNCLSRNYKSAAAYPTQINQYFEEWNDCQREGRSLRERNNRLKLDIKNWDTAQDAEAEASSVLKGSSKEDLIAAARELKEEILEIQDREDDLMSKINAMASAIPNLTSEETPRGDDPLVIDHINPHPSTANPTNKWRSHVDIGAKLNILDFSSAGTTTGWGWYYLLDSAALLEQALIQYALTVTRGAGWRIASPPSIVYSHIANACGFQPRDQNGESQIYAIQQSASDATRGKPELCLAGTAEIPLAGMKADTTIPAAELPIKHVGVSRCYRAEAGARGADTKGLYRVHEFTKVEMFAWTLPSSSASTSVFDEMLAIQTKILTDLNLHFRILEMPSTDLGASASRKRDIEAFFPGRIDIDGGWGEVTSTSTCTDYQTRRLGTRVDLRGTPGAGAGKGKGAKLEFPYTVNGTALAVPRVLAAILESGWREERGVVEVPECLWPWMQGVEVIGKRE